MTKRYVIVGQTASASPNFSLVDLPGTSGRLDVLLRSLRAALLVSHGVRRDTIVYLALFGGTLAPRVLRIDGSAIRFVRPDERALGFLVQKALTRTADVTAGQGFVPIRPGLALAVGGLEAVVADFDGNETRCVLEEGATDVRATKLPTSSVAVFVGDHHGFAPKIRAYLDSQGCIPIGIGPISLHADDAIAILHNEMDRRAHECAANTRP
jgi:tRNA (pseudouridine54-N1)-methyltransferase